MKHLEFDNISLNREDVFRCMGYGRGAAPHEETVQRYEALKKLIPETGPVMGAYEEVPVSTINKNGVGTPYGFIESERLAKISDGIRAMVFGLVTIGNKFDQLAENIPEMVDAFLWDSIGTALVEEGVTQALQRIERDINKSLSLPFSPGYCDWDLSGQSIIFSALDPLPLDITVSSDTLIMSPTKSVSFVSCIDIAGTNHNPCRYCSLKNCFMRRKG